MWYALDVSLSLRAREAVEYALMEAGATGTEFAENHRTEPSVSGYFDTQPQVEQVRVALLDALRIYGLESSDVRSINFREVEETDWLAEWKRGWRPVDVGERFVVAPPWSEIDSKLDRIIIRIEPGMAFGTGTHETTRLCLASLERNFHGGSFLDVGTGTGILAIAAAKLDAQARIDAIDTDPLAIDVARQNAELNGVAQRIGFSVGTIGEDETSASMVCANLTADVIHPMLPLLLDAARDCLVLSGILESQLEGLLARLNDLGATGCEVTCDGEWVAITLKREIGKG